MSIDFQSGVLAQCDRCARATIVRVSQRDMFGEVAELLCAPCWFYDDDGVPVPADERTP